MGYWVLRFRPDGFESENGHKTYHKTSAQPSAATFPTTGTRVVLKLRCQIDLEVMVRSETQESQTKILSTKLHIETPKPGSLNSERKT